MQPFPVSGTNNKDTPGVSLLFFLLFREDCCIMGKIHSGGSYGRIFDYAAECLDVRGAGDPRLYSGEVQDAEAGAVRCAVQAADVLSPALYDLLRCGGEAVL